MGACWFLIAAGPTMPAGRGISNGWRPDGHIAASRRLRFSASGLVAMPDGAALTVDTSARRIVWIASNGDVSVVLPTGAFHDFAGREPQAQDATLVDEQLTFTGLAMSGEGLFVATNQAVLLAPVNAAARTMVRIRDARVADRAPRIRVDSTRVGQVTLTIHRPGSEPKPALVRSVAPVRAGAQWLQIPGPPRRRSLLRVQVQLVAADDVAIDSVTLLLRPTLPVRLVPDLLDEETYTYRCRRMAAKRVDCAGHYTGTGGCDDMVAVVAGRDGVLRQRAYRCDYPRFRPHPRWTGKASIVIPSMNRPL
jgi:hypothetical protein